mgnify:CR=1 FL=1
MKTINDLMGLVAIATEQNNFLNTNHWMINFAGHVNTMSIELYRGGWEKGAYSEKISQKLDEDGTQALYYFLKTRLK